MRAGVVLRELRRACVVGPAAGVAAASRIARELGLSRALTYDMGGTTTDVCLIVDGEADISADRSLAGRPLRRRRWRSRPSGRRCSVVRYDGRVIRVGPIAQGLIPARPVTDWACGAYPQRCRHLLGYLQDGATFGGNIVLSEIWPRRRLRLLLANWRCRPGNGAGYRQGRKQCDEQRAAPGDG